MSEDTKGRITIDWNVEVTDVQDEEPGNSIVVGKSKVDMVNKFLKEGWVLDHIRYDGSLMMIDRSKEEPTSKFVSQQDLQTFSTAVNANLNAGWEIAGEIMQVGDGKAFYCLMQKKA